MNHSSREISVAPESRTLMADALRALLTHPCSLATIRQLATTGELQALLGTPFFEHIATVYERLELMVGDDWQLKLAVLLHEEPPERIPALLDAAGLGSAARTITAVVGGFGRAWKLTSDEERRIFIDAHRDHLEPLVLFELAHEGAGAEPLARLAGDAGLADRFDAWVSRLQSHDSRKE